MTLREQLLDVAAFVTQAVSPDAAVAALATALLEAAALLVCCVGRLDEPATEADRAWALAQADQAAQQLADDVERYWSNPPCGVVRAGVRDRPHR